MSQRHLGELTGVYAMYFIDGMARAVVGRYPLRYSQAHYRKVLRERAARKSGGG
jgi:hypothetical protein